MTRARNSTILAPVLNTCYFLPLYYLSITGMPYIILQSKIPMCTLPQNGKNTYPPKCSLGGRALSLQGLCKYMVDACSSVPQSMKKVGLVWEVLKTGIFYHLPLLWKALEMPCRARDFEHDHILIDLPGYISCKHFLWVDLLTWLVVWLKIIHLEAEACLPNTMVRVLAGLKLSCSF